MTGAMAAERVWNPSQLDDEAPLCRSSGESIGETLLMYSLVSEDGVLGDFANGKGLTDFRTWVEARDDIPAIHRFLDDGFLDQVDLPTLRTDLALVRTDDPWVQACLDALRDASKKAQDILILWNGESDEEGGDEETD
jgi:hypothetical protein